MSDELYRKYRPSTTREMIGQDDAIKTLKGFGDKIPQCILFSGPSGVGKTTLARLLRRRLNCGDFDYHEINAASSRGIDTIREIESAMGLSAINGGAKVYCIDECHRLTKDSQSALLKMLEDTPKHVYFFFATTEPQALLSTVRTRLTEIKLKAIPGDAIRAIVANVAVAESIKVPAAVRDQIVAAAEGSARKALVLLGAIKGIDDEEQQLAAISVADSSVGAIDIARAIFGKGGNWPTVAKLLKAEELDVEAVRHVVLSYATTILLSGGQAQAKAADVISLFAKPFYDSRKAGLALACWDAMNSAKK